MEYTHVIINVCLIWTIAVLSPGPNFFMAAQTAMMKNRKTALQVVLGIGSGTFFWGVCGYLGLSVIFGIAPWFYILLKVLGGGYLIYLGAMMLFRRHKGQARLESELPMATGFVKAYRLGFLTNLSNPKAVVFTTSLFAATVPPNPPLLLGVATIGIMFTLSTAWYAIVACIFSSSRMAKTYAGLRKWIDRCSGIIFIGFGLKFALLDR